MASERKKAANKRNAQKSTGPRTAAGKEVSRYNALQHGLTARSLVVLGERQADFDDLRMDLEAALSPTDAIEKLLVDRVVVAAWRLQRVARVEAAMFEAPVAAAERDAAKAKASEHVHFEPSEMEKLSWSFGGTDSKPVVTNAREHARWTDQAKQFERVTATPDGAQAHAMERPENSLALTSLGRYEAHLWRCFTDALRELERYRKRRSPAAGE